MIAAVRVPPSAPRTSQSIKIEFSPNLEVDAAAKRATDQAADLVRTAADLALDRLPIVPGVRRSRQHGVLSGNPSESTAFPPARDAFRRRGGTQHAGRPELDEDTALSVRLPPPGDCYRAEFSGTAAIRTGHVERR